jgi:anti-sigma factor RsiW
MTEEQQLKLQSFLDGELPENEAREIAAWIARDGEAKALHAELKNTRRAIKDSEAIVRLPESREFYWSKIRREIERLEPVSEKPVKVSPFVFFRRLLMPLSAVAAVVIAGLLMFRGTGPVTLRHSLETEVASAGSDAFTYRDYSAGMTLVWLPFPAENELAAKPAATTIQ